MGFSENTIIDFKENYIDSFGRQRNSNPTGIFDSQLTYDLQPLIFEQIITGTGATITHDAVNRKANFNFAATPTGGSVIMQSYKYHLYQPGKSQLIDMSFNFFGGTTNVTKFCGYSDGTNGVEFQNDGTNNKFVILSSTGSGNQTALQSNWNLDKLDGTGNSKITLDITKDNIVVIDLQALYTGRVRCGFNIGGTIVYVHEFNNANNKVTPYIALASLPVRIGMTCTGTVTTSMSFTCSSVVSEGGSDTSSGYDFTADTANNLVASNGVDTHAVTIRPKLLFNGITNRISFIFLSLDILVTGNSPVEWKLCIGQQITGGVIADVNTAYSSIEKVTGATLVGTPAIIIDENYVAASNQTKGKESTKVLFKYPITLDAAGNQRDLGAITLLVQGLGGASACRAALKFTELR